VLPRKGKGVGPLGRRRIVEMSLRSMYIRMQKVTRRKIDKNGRLRRM
jgi:hypothetical protein